MAGPAESSATPPITTASVVIPSIGRARLAAVVAAVVADSATTEVLVIADRDRPACEAVLGEAGLGSDPRVAVLSGPGLGAASARQAGIDHATGDLVVLLDDDVVPEPGLVTAHCDAHRGRTRTIVVGPMPVSDELRDASAVARVYANDYAGEWSELQANAALVLHELWAGNVSLRRDDAAAVPQVGPVGILQNREDQEFGLRAAAAGFVGALAPRARAVHWHDRDAKAMLHAAKGQARTGRLLVAQFPELEPDRDPAHGFPRPLHALVTLSTRPVIGPVVRGPVVAAAGRLGNGPPTRWRLGLLVVARAMVQRSV